MPNRIASDLPTILTALENRLVVQGVLDRSLILTSLTDAESWASYPADQQFLLLAPGRFAADQGFLAGGGNDLLAFGGSLVVTLWSALSTDLANTDRDWLRDQTNGVLAKFKAILAALSLFDPTDADGNLLLEEPMRLLTWEAPPRKAGQDWGRLVMAWECKWLQSLG